MGQMLLVLTLVLAGVLGLAIAAGATDSGAPTVACPPTTGVSDPNLDVKRGSCLFRSTTAFGQKDPTAMFASCAGCHPDGRTDQTLHAIEVTDTAGHTVTVFRRAPNLRNVVLNVPLGWDGRHGGTPGDLESIRIAIMRAAFGAIMSPLEMQGTLSSLSLAQFQSLAAFLISRSPTGPEPGTPEPGKFDQDTLDRVAVGRGVFFGKGQCSTCHPAPFFTDNRIRTNVLHPSARFDFSGDRGAAAVGTGGEGEYKTPSLHHFYPDGRPFMHNGGLGLQDSQLFLFYQKSLGFTLTGEEQTGLHYWLQNCPRGAGRHPLTLPSTCF